MRGLKLLTFVSALCLSAVSISVVLISPPNGYTLTLWDAVPQIVLFLLIIGIVCAVVCTALAVYKNSNREFIGGISLFAGFYLILLSLPRHVGMRFWASPRSDMFQHFADVNHLTAGGTDLSIYPLLHILIAETSLITTTPPEAHHIIIVFFAWLMFVTGCSLFMRRIFCTRVAKWTLVAALPPIFASYQYSLMPWFVSFTMVPLALLAATISYSSFEWKPYQVACTLLIFIGVTMFHPMTGVILIVLLGITSVIQLHRISQSWKKGIAMGYQSVFPLIIIWFMWFAWTGVFRGLGIQIFEMLNQGASVGSLQAERASESGYTQIQIIKRVLLNQLNTIPIYTLIGGFVTLNLGYQYYFKKSSQKTLLLIVFYILGSSLTVSMLAAYFIITEPHRVAQLQLFASVLLVGYGAAQFAEAPNNRVQLHRLGLGIIVVSIIVSSLVGGWAMYDNREHVVETELKGSEWVLEYANHDHRTVSRYTAIRMNAYLAGIDALPRIGWGNLPFGYRPDAVPQGLGYANNSTVAESFSVSETETGSINLVTKQRDRSWYKIEPENRYSEITYYTDEDMKRLNGDLSAHQVYSNGEFELWRVSV